MSGKVSVGRGWVIFELCSKCSPTGEGGREHPEEGPVQIEREAIKRVESLKAQAVKNRRAMQETHETWL